MTPTRDQAIRLLDAIVAHVLDEIRKASDASVDQAVGPTEESRPTGPAPQRSSEDCGTNSPSPEPTLYVNFNVNGAAIDVFHRLEEAERRPGFGDIRKYVPAARLAEAERKVAEQDYGRWALGKERDALRSRAEAAEERLRELERLLFDSRQGETIAREEANQDIADMRERAAKQCESLTEPGFGFTTYECARRIRALPLRSYQADKENA